MTGPSPAGAPPFSRRPRAEKSAAVMTPSPLASTPLQLTTAPPSASATRAPSPSVELATELSEVRRRSPGRRSRHHRAVSGTAADAEPDESDQARGRGNHNQEAIARPAHPPPDHDFASVCPPTRLASTPRLTGSRRKSAENSEVCDMAVEVMMRWRRSSRRAPCGAKRQLLDTSTFSRHRDRIA